MLEVDIDDSGTVDFFEFLCVARLISQGKGTWKVLVMYGILSSSTQHYTHFTYNVAKHFRPRALVLFSSLHINSFLSETHTFFVCFPLGRSKRSKTIRRCPKPTLFFQSYTLKTMRVVHLYISNCDCLAVDDTRKRVKSNRFQTRKHNLDLRNITLIESRSWRKERK